MSKLEEVYGNNFKNKIIDNNTTNIINQICNNIILRQFNFSLCSEILWENNRIKPEYLNKILNVIKKKFIIENVPINIVHSIIKTNVVEYFIIVDKEYSKIYTIYITPYEIGLL